MKLDLAFLLVDLGEPWYKTAASEMIRSARRAFSQHDLRVVQITDNRRIIHPDVDGGFEADVDCIPEQLAQFRGHMFAEFALQADRPVIFSDVELLWESDALAQKLEDLSIMCMKREMLPSFDTSVMTTAPGQREFWTFYRKSISELPTALCAKDGDHFAMMAAALRYMNKIWILTESSGKGFSLFRDDRQGMIQKARELDKGEGFEFVRPSVCANPAHEAERLRDEAFCKESQWNAPTPGRPQGGPYQMAADVSKLYAEAGVQFKDSGWKSGWKF